MKTLKKISSLVFFVLSVSAYAQQEGEYVRAPIMSEDLNQVEFFVGRQPISVPGYDYKFENINMAYFQKGSESFVGLEIRVQTKKESCTAIYDLNLSGDLHSFFVIEKFIENEKFYFNLTFLAPSGKNDGLYVNSKAWFRKDLKYNTCDRTIEYKADNYQ